MYKYYIVSSVKLCMYMILHGEAQTFQLADQEEDTFFDECRDFKY